MEISCARSTPGTGPSTSRSATPTPDAHAHAHSDRRSRLALATARAAQTTAITAAITGLIATAIALSSGAPIFSTWNNNFLWSAPSYFVGAGTAALAASFVAHAGYWVAPFTFAPLYLTYRTYKVYMGRIDDEPCLATFHEVEIFSELDWWQRDPDEVLRVCKERYERCT